MSTRRFGLFFRLSLGVVVAGLPAIAQAADLPLQPRMRSTDVKDHAGHASDAREMQITPSGRASPANRGPIGSAAGYLAAARARFNEARVAMEHGLLLRDATPKADIATLESAMREFFYDLKQLEAVAAPRSVDSSKKA